MAKPIILIHGAWHAKWSWKNVVPQLTEHGHLVINIDLPGHGENTQNFKEISLSTYVEYVTKIIQTLNQPVALVGHSLAGVIISQVAENIPELIDQLIYVTAFIPDNGGSLTDEAKKAASPGVATELMIDLKKNEADIKRSQRVKDLFYNLCTKDDIDFVMSKLQIEPYRPLIDAISVSENRFGNVKKVYIECLDDMAVTKEDQKRMYSKHHCRVISIKADHSPFFSAPTELSDAILNCVSDSIIV